LGFPSRFLPGKLVPGLDKRHSVIPSVKLWVLRYGRGIAKFQLALAPLLVPVPGFTLDLLEQMERISSRATEINTSGRRLVVKIQKPLFR
jgi:hypothetical protein